MLILKTRKEIIMKTLIATFVLASVVATSAVAKNEKNSATFVAPDNSVICGRVVLADPDPGVRAQLRRDCAHHDGAN
jgi:hypothetical protein